MKVKVIDLLNKIANGEEVPKKIRFGSYIYEYKEDELGYIDYVRTDTSKHLFGEDYIMDGANLNEEVEINEEDKKIEKLDEENLNRQFLTTDEIRLAKKINEIIDYINKENK